MDNVNEIYVYENWKSDTPSLIGTLYVDGGRGKQVVSFEYDDAWLNDLTNNVTLDPDLRLFKGCHGSKLLYERKFAKSRAVRV